MKSAPLHSGVLNCHLLRIDGEFIEANMLPPTKEILNVEDHDLCQLTR